MVDTRLLERILDRDPWDVRALDPKAPFLFLIWEVETLHHHTLVRGLVIRGTLGINEALEIVGQYPQPISTKITRYEPLNKLVTIKPGMELALRIPKLPNDVTLQRGMVLTKPGRIIAPQRVSTLIHVLTTEEGGMGKYFASGYEALLEFRTLLLSYVFLFA